MTFFNIVLLLFSLTQLFLTYLFGFLDGFIRMALHSASCIALAHSILCSFYGWLDFYKATYCPIRRYSPLLS